MNFTWRARGLMSLAALATAIGLLLRQEPLVLSGLTIFLWIALEWTNFCFRTLTADPMFADARRSIGGQARSSHVLVIDREVEVEIELAAARRLAGLRCVVQDAVPSEIPLAGGSPSFTADVAGSEKFTWRYRLRPRIIGKSMLPGLQATISDPQGLFRMQRFIPLRTEVSVLPFLIRPQATVSVLKRQNVQMLPGLHRHRKPGFSTELLGIRDYRSGDPPRSIAWKATARRGKLMTCEYENEAPVRATVLADLSPLQFVGRPGPAGAERVIAAAASVARLLLADGDPVAGLIVSRGEQAWLPHGAGERHLSRLLLRMLSLRTPLSLDDLELDDVTRLAWTCGFRRFPELFDEAVNQPLVGLFVRGRARRHAARQRQQLSLALRVVYGGEAGLPMRLRFDDRLYRDYCRRLLEDYPGLLDGGVHGSPRISSADEGETTETLCRGLVTGAARSNDNELFVIVGTIPFEGVHRDRLLEAIRVLRAGHHRVVMIDVGADVLNARWEDDLARRILSDTRRDASADRFVDFERRLVRLGGKLARLPDAKLIERVAAEIEILRMGRTRTMGGAR